MYYTGGHREVTMAEAKTSRRRIHKHQAVEQSKLLELPLKACQPNPHQPRQVFEEEALQELAASIKQHGLLQPITVMQEGEGYIIVAGERRYRAFQLLKKKTIPAILTSGKADELALIENLQRGEPESH